MPNYTEPRVLSVVRNLCKPGNDVFDVGANFGGVTIAMSRAVGPRGSVLAFEANPGIAKRCQDNMVAGGCTNSQLFHGAIYSRSGEEIDLYISENQVADSIHHRVSDKSIKVPTLALDDVVRSMNVRPAVVKMDIEGAEYDALLGFEDTLKFARPYLILEQAPQEPRCVEFLIERGYKAIDLSTYQDVSSISDLVADTVVTDILFGHGDSLERAGYRSGLSEIATLAGSDFINGGKLILSKPLALEPGRYVVKADFASADDDVQEVFCGAWITDAPEPLMQHHGHSHSLSRLAHRWVFDIPRATSASMFFNFPQAVPNTFDVKGVQLWRVTCSGATPPYWV
ncbi:FkbM family methyltransferase [Methylobacterium brachiatum]